LGLAVGLLIGWRLWPVEYKQAYTYQLVDEEKQQYLAAVVDSYNLTKQVDVAQKRLDTWTPEEKVTGLARLFAEYQSAGKAQEAQQVATLAAELQRVEGWDPTLVGEITSQVATQYAGDAAPEKAQAVSVFASALAVSATPTSSVSTPAASSPQARIPLVRNLQTLVICAVLLLAGALIALIVVFSSRRRAKDRAAKAEEEVWTGAGPPPLLQRTSSYALGMDNFDESFAIETKDKEWLGECGMGISESLDDGTPRRVIAFEVWLFDKPSTRTVTKVLMSDFANTNEALRNKLSSRGDPVLATPGGTFTLETPALTVRAQIVEVEYGEGTPAFGYFNSLKVSLTAHRRSETDESSDVVQ
jgi:hypothetical protein